MALTPEDVRNKQFATVKFRDGYNLDEVDAFLDEVEAEIIRLSSENEDLRDKLAKAAAPPPVVAPNPPLSPPPAAPVVPPNEAAVAMLALAQKTADEYVANAKAEADRVLAGAKSQAERALSEKDVQRSALEKKIEELRAFEREYRTRLRTYIEGQLHELDTRSGDTARPATAPAASMPPAAPPVPPRPNTPPPGSGAGEATRPLPPTPPPVPPVPPAPSGVNLPTAPPREG